ncbi:hypothetical protein K9L97_03325 [Candidatus Woesearchaeota archaeon]|nr:hypothetical protein [Candidatus Woesearchaeota archaeon]
MKYFVYFIIFLLVVSFASANVLPIIEDKTYMINAEQNQLNRFVFTNSPKSATLHLAVSGGSLKAEGKSNMQSTIAILPGETKIIEAQFSEAGTHYIINYGKETRIFAVVKVKESKFIFPKSIASEEMA